MRYLDNVRGFCVVSEGVAFLQEKTLYINNLDFYFASTQLYQIGENIFSGKNFLFNGFLGVVYLDKLDGKYFSGLFHNNLLVYTDFDKFYFYDFKCDVILYSHIHFIDRSICFFNHCFFLCQGEGWLFCHTIETGEELWRIDFTELLRSEKAELFGDLIVHDEKLFFFLSDYNKGSVFCIDMHNGTVLLETDAMNGWLQKVENKLYSLSKSCLKMMDICTFDEKQYDLSDLIAKHNLYLAWNKYVIDKDKFYFVSENVAGGGTAIVGIINLNNLVVEWQTNIEIEEGSYWIKEIRVVHEKLYVHTQSGTLYIFEKE